MLIRPFMGKSSTWFAIFLLLMAVLAAVFVMVYKDFRLNEAQIAEEIGEQARILAEQTSIGLTAHIENIKSRLGRNAGALGLAGIRLEEAAVFIDKLYKSFEGAVTAVAVLDPNGIGLAIAPEEFVKVFVENDFSTRDYFQKTKTTRDAYVSSIFITAAGNKRIAVAAPIMDRDGVFSGTMAAYVDVEALSGRFIENIKFRGRAYTVLTDGSGVILHHPDARYRGRDILKQASAIGELDDRSVMGLVKYVESNESGKGSFYLRDRPGGRLERKIIAYSSIPLGATKWYLAIVSDYSAAMAAVRFSIVYLITILAIVVGLLGAAGLLYAKFEGAKIRAVEEARLNREWQETFDAMADPIYILDKEYSILKANKACCSRAGLGADEIIGKKSCKAIFGRDKPPDSCPCLKSLADGLAHVAEVHSPAGETFLITSSPIFAPKDRRASRVIVHAKDITERVKAAKEFSEANRLLLEQKEQLEQQKEKLSNSMQELQSLQDHLVNNEKLASLGRLAAGLAHEILNPLNIITMIAQLLLMSGKLDEETSGDMTKIKAQVDRAAKITDSLAVFAGQRKADKVETDINEIVEKTLTLVQFEMTRENIVIIKNFSQSCPHVMVDRDQIMQAILNLIINARESMPDGGQLTIETRSRGNRAEMILSDSGRGIDNNILGKIYDPFFTTKQVGKGTGLGLSVSYGIVESHGGAIRAFSEPGKGSTFIVELPAAG